MQLWSTLFSTDYGLLSIGVIAFVNFYDHLVFKVF